MKQTSSCAHIIKHETFREGTSTERTVETQYIGAIVVSWFNRRGKTIREQAPFCRTVSSPAEVEEESSLLLLVCG